MNKNRMPLDAYELDYMPKAQKIYLMHHGWHFDKNAYEYAASMMRRINKSTGKLEKVPRYTKEEVDSLLRKYSIEVEEKGGYDYVYVAQMCKADLYGSSIPDEQHLAMYVKDVCDDADLAEGTIMRKWYASMVAMGEPVEWEELLGDD
jgi:phosphorylcholine metabolism protein LicD